MRDRLAHGRPSRDGPGRVLVVVYAVFVVAAGARSVVQLATHASRAPIAYALSVLAAGVYVTGFVLVRRADAGAARAVRAARACCLVELGGVVAVGTASVLAASAFPDSTVWSYFGVGYGFVPLLLPLAVLAWLPRAARRRAAPSDRVLVP